jgi:stage V sporulation protein R
LVDEAANHARRMNGYEYQYGRKVVEDFLDAVLSIEEHIDPNFFIRKERDKAKKDEEKLKRAEGRYDDLFSQEELGVKSRAEEEAEDTRNLEAPEKDLVYYIMQHSPILKDWQRDVMSMLHQEMEYFVPQMQTKIMNEGWASIWHSRILREMDLPTNDHLEFAELHAGVVSPHRGQLNPYYLGYKIWEDIERRWETPSQADRDNLWLVGGEGRYKMFEVRETENDISFLRNYLTEELCEELDLFVYELVDEEEWTVTEKRCEKVRNQLVANMTNFGFPYIDVIDGDYDRNRELYLQHRYEGVELDMKYAHKTLEYIHKLWGRDVHLETIVDNEPLVLHYDGEEHTED